MPAKLVRKARCFKLGGIANECDEYMWYHGSGGNESRLVLTSDATGTKNAISVTVIDDDGNNIDSSGLSALVYDPGGTGITNMTVLQAADDAQILPPSRNPPAYAWPSGRQTFKRRSPAWVC